MRNTKFLDNLCGPYVNLPSVEKQLYSEQKLPFDNILLVFMFNTPHYSVIPILEIIYRRRFQNIVYCGADHKDIEPLRQKWGIKFIAITFDEPEVVAGEYMNLRCMLLAMELMPDAEGYLFVHDDVVLNYWNLAAWNRTKIWLTRDSGIADLDKMLRCNAHGACHPGIVKWIYMDRFRNSTLKGLDSLSSNQSSQVEKNCIQNLKKEARGTHRIFFGQADIYYVPGRLRKAFSTIGKSFSKVFLEISLPTILKCMGSRNDRQRLPFCHDLPGAKNENYKLYKNFTNKPYFHRYKLGKMFGNPNKTKFFCENFLTEVALH